MSDDAKPIVLYPFKVRDDLSGKWRRTRYKASLEEIERLGGEVCGEPVVYQSLGNTSNFLRNSVAAPVAVPDRLEMHPHWESPPTIEPIERFLVQTFLRRYATWCARTNRFAAAQGAAVLCRELS